MFNLCRRRNAFSSGIAAVILSVPSIGSPALADDCPLIAESCACQSSTRKVQAHARQRPVLRRVSAKSASVSVSKSEDRRLRR